MRRRLSYANVVATLALVFAMSGGALAANHYLINSTKQISPKLLKKLKGRAGRTGATGLPGAKGLPGTAGAQGKEGLPGKEGARGQSALQPLESGQTITGVGGARFQNGAVAKSPVGVVVSFPVRAPTPLSGARVELAPTVNCTGSTATPTAAPGFACIYEDVNVNVEKIEPGGPVTVPDPWGFMVDWSATAANQQSSLRFTWAYTAP
jgi:hypothetical protein